MSSPTAGPPALFPGSATAPGPGRQRTGWSGPFRSPQWRRQFEAHRCTPAVTGGDFVRRPPGGDAPTTGGIAERHATGHDPAFVGRDPEDGVRLGTVEDAEHDGQSAADTLGPGGQLGTPDGRVDGSARRVVLGE